MKLSKYTKTLPIPKVKKSPHFKFHIFLTESNGFLLQVRIVHNPSTWMQLLTQYPFHFTYLCMQNANLYIFFVRFWEAAQPTSYHDDEIV